MGIVRDLYMARKMSAGVNIPAPSVAQYIKRRRLAGSSETYEGDVVEFETAKAKKLKELSVLLSPIQDLHGYDAPWPAGGGKNKIPYPYRDSAGTVNGVTIVVHDDGSITLSGKATATVTFTLFTSTEFDASAFNGMIMNGVTGGSLSSYFFRVSDVSLLSVDNTNGDTTIAGLSNTGSVNIYARVANGYEFASPVTIYPMIRQSGTGATFAPYENLCPITGHSSASAWRTGKNLFDSSISEKLDTPIISWGTSDADIVAWFNSLPNGSYAISFTVTIDSIRGSSQNNYYGAILANSVTGNTIIRPNVENPTEGMELDLSGTITITDSNRGKFTNFWLYTGRAMADTPDECTFSNFMVELGSTATDYEAFSGDLFSVDWTDDAGTVYSGTVDIVTGVLRVRPEYASYNGETLVGEWMSSMDKYVAGTTPTIGAQVVDLGGEETVYQLTPQQVMSLVGSNVIWSPDGSVKVRV